MPRFPFVFVVICATSLVGGEPSTEKQKQDQGFASPREVWDAARYAEHEGRWRDTFRCLTPANQLDAIFGVMVLEAMCPPSSNTVKIEAILRRFGLDDPPAKLAQMRATMKAKGAEMSDTDQYLYMLGLIAEVKDKETLFDEMMSQVYRDEESRKGKSNKSPIPVSELTSLKISGDRARGEYMRKLDESEKMFTRLGVRRTEVQEKLDFRKIGSRWLIDVTVESPEEKKSLEKIEEMLNGEKK
jgi:hypothetical protein